MAHLGVRMEGEGAPAPKPSPAGTAKAPKSSSSSKLAKPSAAKRAGGASYLVQQAAGATGKPPSSAFSYAQNQQFNYRCVSIKGSCFEGPLTMASLPCQVVLGVSHCDAS